VSLLLIFQQPSAAILKRFQLLLPIVLLFMAVLAASTVSLASATENSDWDALSKGDVVVKQNPAPANTAPSVEAKILISRPPEKVWNVVADPETLMSQERKVQKVKVLSHTANKQNVAFSVSMTRLFPPFNYVLLQELSPPNLLRFHRISGSFKDIQGSWKLLPVDRGNKTILTYTLQLDPGPFIPRSLLLGAVKSDLPSMMRNAKLAIDKSTR
jgi:ribosome-associated toxin RatA of RatAB toxin-antitoxin module